MIVRLKQDATIRMPAGSIVEVDTEKANWLIGMGLAEKHIETVIETAAVAPAETRKKSTRKKKD